METIPEESSSQTGDNDSLHRRSCSRCKALGSIQLFKVRYGHRQLEFHKCTLVARSGYLARMLKNTCHVTLPSSFPGGIQAFEAMMDMCNGSSVALDASNVAILRCAAEYLEMSTLCERLDLRLDQALTNWPDAIRVLLSCSKNPKSWKNPKLQNPKTETLHFAEELGIIDRFSEALACTICTEMERSSWRRNHSRTWIADLILLPCRIFSKIISICVKQRLSARNVGNLVVNYAEKRLFSGIYPSDCEEEEGTDYGEDVVDVLNCVVRLLPFEKGAISVAFLFELLRYSIAVDAPVESTVEIEMRISRQLDMANKEDLLTPFKSANLSRELDSMNHIISLYMSHVGSNPGPAADLWDAYLAEVAYCDAVTVARFAELIDAVPSSTRASHDRLYKAIHIFLKAHPMTTQQERSVICRSLDCHRLSQEAYIHAVQNELMPLKTMIRRIPRQNAGVPLAVDGYRRINGYDDEEILPFVLKQRVRDHGFKADLEATNMKLDSLEQQLVFIRKALEETYSTAGNLNLNLNREGPSRKTGSMGKKISKALQKIGICKGNSQGIPAGNPVEKCFPIGSSEESEHLLEETLAPRRSTSSRDEAASSRRHCRRYSVS